MSGPAAGRRHGGGLRPDAHPAGADKTSAIGTAAGPAILADRYGGAVYLVPKRLGRADPAVRSGLLSAGWGTVFLGGESLAAETGLPGSRFGEPAFGHFDLSAGAVYGTSEKNQKNYKKHLPFRGEMV